MFQPVFGLAAGATVSIWVSTTKLLCGQKVRNGLLCSFGSRSAFENVVMRQWKDDFHNIRRYSSSFSKRVEVYDRTKNRMFAIFVPLHTSSTSKRSRGIVELRKGETRAHQRQSLNFAVSHPCRKTWGILTANKCCGIYERKEL
jgi:hypothetical protein